MEDVDDEQEENASDSIANPPENLQFMEDAVETNKDENNVYSAHEVDFETERQMFVNDVPTRRDSSISIFFDKELLDDRSRSRPQSSSNDDGIEERTRQNLLLDRSFQIPPREGQTRIPRAKVSTRALLELGHPFEEEVRY